MGALIEFAFLALHLAIQAVIWLVIASAIFSWLVAFDVINTRNRMVYQVVRFLDAVTRPILTPFRRIIPTLGGVDISPMVLIILLEAADQALLPALYSALVSMVT
jgi:YggT family protein